MEQQFTYKCLEPRGNHLDAEFVSPADRFTDASDKTVYFVDIGKKNSDVILKKAMILLEEQFPHSKFVYYPKTKGFQFPEPEDWWQEIESNADAALVAVGD